ncbi:FAD-dependent oxidoreductase [Streptomyces sp. NEAU-Y11]|uniref:FAD-dependent oxidoreductase n=1 Tax=Streptomyces cucumeris TaxID=2962890 RepID=UPI0020C9277E|nr:NAD(P)/FAD-dependent oxidoreductase [Streptomyces sp. NEAU-Y11]MCP9212257.1 FAD-dependent oxidoreductase [Streptomyces sp. NEAU-Y11]
MPISPAEPGPAAVHDIVVLGAGPAGLATAVAAAARGARVALVDAGPRPGGQYWRHRAGDDGAAHHDWDRFRRLRDGLDAHRDLLDHRSGHTVWHVERTGAGFTVHTLHAGRPYEIRGRTVVVATGAYDRQVPFPGWTTPGVFTAGAVQALLKGQGVVAGRRIAVAGTGPFLLPVAAGLAEAGAEVVGVFEAGRPLAFGRHPFTVVRNAAKLAEGAGYLRTLARHRIPYRTRTTVVAAHGTDSVTGVTVARLDAGWRTLPGSARTLDCDTVAVGYGFTPQTELAVQLGCAMERDGDGSLVARVDSRQRSSVDGVYAAGEACGVGGARLSLIEGELAGLHAAWATTGARPDRRRLARLLRRRAAQRSFAAALHRAYPVPGGWRTWLEEDTVVCRCEEVDVAAVRRAVTELGATDPRTVKLCARPGMGLCQGRVCGYATAGLVAEADGREVTADDLRGMAGRPIAQPLPLGVLAAGADGAGNEA